MLEIFEIFGETDQAVFQGVVKIDDITSGLCCLLVNQGPQRSSEKPLKNRRGITGAS